MPHEAPREGVAGPRGVEDALQRIGRRREEGVVGQHQGAVLAALHHHHARPHPGDDPGGADEVRLAGQLAGLGVVDGDDVDLAEDAQEGLALPWIQKFMVSRATSRGRSAIWRRTSSWSSGSMLARNRYGTRRRASGRVGRKVASTLSWVSRVRASLRS